MIGEEKPVQLDVFPTIASSKSINLEEQKTSSEMNEPEKNEAKMEP